MILALFLTLRPSMTGLHTMQAVLHKISAERLDYLAGKYLRMASQQPDTHV